VSQKKERNKKRHQQQQRCKAAESKFNNVMKSNRINLILITGLDATRAKLSIKWHMNSRCQSNQQNCQSKTENVNQRP
jgi:hypothetical protein